MHRHLSRQKKYDVIAVDVGLVFGLPKIGHILPIASTPSDLPFGTIRTCEERLLNLLVGEEF